MPKLLTSLTLMISALISQAHAERDYSCLKAASRVAVHELNKITAKEQLAEYSLEHDKCLWNSQTEMIECLRGETAWSEYTLSGVFKRRISPTRSDVEYEFSGGVPGVDVFVRATFAQTPNSKCRLVSSEFSIEQTDEE